MKKYIVALVVAFALTSSPVHAQATLTPEQVAIYQQVINTLLAQVQVLIQQLAQLQGVQVASNTPAPEFRNIGGVVEPVTPYPVEITGPIYAHGWGGGCGLPTVGGIYVKYSNGKHLIGGESIDVYFPDGVKKTLTVNNGRSNEFVDSLFVGGIDISLYGYIDKNIMSTTTKLLLVKGDLKKEITIEIEPRIIEKENIHLRYETSGANTGKYVLDTTGITYNPDTYQCNY